MVTRANSRTSPFTNVNRIVVSPVGGSTENYQLREISRGDDRDLRFKRIGCMNALLKRGHEVTFRDLSPDTTRRDDIVSGMFPSSMKYRTPRYSPAPPLFLSRNSLSLAPSLFLSVPLSSFASLFLTRSIEANVSGFGRGSPGTSWHTPRIDRFESSRSPRIEIGSAKHAERLASPSRRHRPAPAGVNTLGRKWIEALWRQPDPSLARSGHAASATAGESATAPPRTLACQRKILRTYGRRMGLRENIMVHRSSHTEPAVFQFRVPRSTVRPPRVSGAGGEKANTATLSTINNTYAPITQKKKNKRKI